MITFTILNIPTEEQARQIIGLYMQQGWWGGEQEEPDLVDRIVAGSHCFVIAQRKGEIIGMGRAISDGVSDAYIQDMAVKTNFKRKGIGKKILETLLSRIKNDGLGWIGLIAEKGSWEFYSDMGFEKFQGALPMILKK